MIMPPEDSLMKQVLGFDWSTDLILMLTILCSLVGLWWVYICDEFEDDSDL